MAVPSQTRVTLIIWTLKLISVLTVARPFFSKERVTDFLLYERKAMTCVQKMEEHFDRNLPIDFQVRYQTRFVFDILNIF